MENTSNKAYKRWYIYLEKYAKKHHISVEEAKTHKVPLNVYEAYLNETGDSVK